MTDAAVASPAAPPAAAPSAHSTSGLGHVPPPWLWPLSIVLQTLSAAALTGYTYFFVDDWLFIAQARTQPLGLSYLREPLFEHFSPVSRLLDKLLIQGSSGSFALAHSLQLLMYAAAIAAFALVARAILGNRWSALALTIFFGQSLFLMRLLNWWTATANILPATVLGLIAFGGYLRWRESRSRWWLVIALLAFVGSLLDYETAMLFPVYVLLVRLLVLEVRISARAWLAAIWNERAVWLGFALFDLAALYNYYADYYTASAQASLGRTLHFFELALFETFVPALFGIKNPQAPVGRQGIVILLCVVLALAVAAYVIYTRPRTWRCLAAFGVIALITMLPVGINRVVRLGVHLGHELYYQQSLQFMFLILVAFALRCEPRRAGPRLLSATAARLRSAPAATAALTLAGLGGYGVLFVTSVNAMATASLEPQRARAYVTTFRASVQSVTRRTGLEPVLFNAQTPSDITGFVPFNSYAMFFPMIDSRVHFNAVVSPVYVVDRLGRLVALRFIAHATGRLARATVLDLSQPRPHPAQRRGSYACIPAGNRSPVLRIPLSTPQRVTAAVGQLPFALRLSVRTPAPASVPVLLDEANGRVSYNGFPPIFSRGDSEQYVPLTAAALARGIDLELPGGACVRSLALGSFGLAAR